MFEDYLNAYDIRSAKNLLGLNTLKLYPFRSREDIIQQVRQGSTDGLDVLVGGGTLAYRTGNSYGIRVLPVQSGHLSLQNAIQQAISVIDARQREKLQLKCFTEAVSSITEGVLSTEEGRIILANKETGNVFKTEPSTLMGRKLHDIGDSLIPEHIRQFLTNGIDSDEILKIRGQNYYVKKSHFDENGKRRTIAVFRRVSDIQEQEQRARTEIRKTGFSARYQFADIIGESPTIKQLIAKAKLYAVTDANILIGGESGTGKELLAQSIHNASFRANEPFVAVNCAAIPASLLESELFGYEEGAFSGARKGGKQGLFELAHKGTIFLDEINSMPLELQSVLLRTLQEKEVRRIGSQRNIYVDIRVIAASNKDLTDMIQENKFRADLFYRLNTLRLILPSLDERKSDIHLLADSFLQDYCQKYGSPKPQLSPENLQLLMEKKWPGNIRELRNVIQRFVILSQIEEPSIVQCFDDDIHANGWISSSEQFSPPPVSEAESPENTIPKTTQNPLHKAMGSGTLEEIERGVILERLKQNQGNRTKTAEDLGISRSTLWKKLENYKVFVQER